ncbi:DUF2877 domain-containing protein [Tissierella sp. MSJ-40]|uniref:DUF2877 domain-containing protein n=1 Tax=Tissierella simiarum TaxID=2841534 RepID=A0ABS6E233_9FIRM|nr:DUF2877 domain-containing protein [Tissierella simiarum]MBU5436957.1 DUF2877 domain-containing protein [Tissierella simiarum]
MSKEKYEIIKFNASTYDKHFIRHFNENKNGEKIGEIHSIYSRTINFLDKKKSMYTIGSKNIDNSPFTLRIDSEDINFEDLNLKEGNLLFKVDNNLVIDNKVEINISPKSLLWNPALYGRKDLDKGIITNNIDYFNNLILSNGSYGGCKYFYLKNYLKEKNHKPTLIEKELARRIEILLDTLNYKVIDKDKINSLIGFGVGLTPSGDDFLTGFLSTFNIISTDYTTKIKEKLTDLIDINKISTTDVSKQMLLITLKGEAREYVLNFINSFLDGNKDRFLFSFKNLLNIGSSSGTDLAIGVVTAFNLSINNFNMEEWKL